MTREQVLRHPAYWFEHEQNELFRQFHSYMKNEKINQTQLAERLGITKGRVSQILRGESNFSIKTLIELGLSIGVIPKIKYIPVEQELKEDSLNKPNKKSLESIAWKTIINESPFEIHTTCGGVIEAYLEKHSNKAFLYNKKFEEETSPISF